MPVPIGAGHIPRHWKSDQTSASDENGASNESEGGPWGVFLFAPSPFRCLCCVPLHRSASLESAFSARIVTIAPFNVILITDVEDMKNER